MVYKTLATDFFYENSGITSLSYYITADSGTIYTGRAFNPKGIKINVRKAIDDWLVNDMPDFREYDGVMVIHEDAYKVFGLYDMDGTLLEEYGVFLTNENIGIGDLTYRGIDGKADPRQKIFVGVMSEEPVEIDVNARVRDPEIIFDRPFWFEYYSGVTTICYTANTDFTLSSYDGGWFTVTQTKADGFTGCLTFTYTENGNPSERDGTMCMDYENYYGVVETRCFPVVQDRTGYFIITTPSGRIVPSTSTAFTFYYETNMRHPFEYEHITQSGATETGLSYSNSSLTITFQENEDLVSKTHTVNIGGQTIYWYQSVAQPYFNVLPNWTMFGWEDTKTITATTNVDGFVITTDGEWIKDTDASKVGSDVTIDVSTELGDVLSSRTATFYVYYSGMLLATFTLTQSEIDTGSAIIGVSDWNDSFYLKGEDRPDNVEPLYSGICFYSRIFSAETPYYSDSGYVNTNESGLIAHIGPLGSETPINATASEQLKEDRTVMWWKEYNFCGGGYHTLIFPKRMTHLDDGYTVKYSSHYDEKLKVISGVIYINGVPLTVGEYTGTGGEGFLKKIYWNSTIPVINRLCSGCDSLEYVYSNATEIGRYSFSSNHSLAEVEGLENASVIGYGAFAGDKNLSALTIGGNATIGEYAFSGCTSLPNIDFTNQTIKGGAFTRARIDCDNDVLVIESGVTWDGTLQFEFASGFTSISARTETLPGGVFKNTSVVHADLTGVVTADFKPGPYDYGTFPYSHNLESVYAPDLVYSSGSTFMECENLTSVYLPKLKKMWCRAYDYSWDEIGATFYRCRSIETISLPSIEYVGSWAFSSCPSLRHVYLGSGLTQISAAAFSGSTGLTYLEFGGTCREFDNVYVPVARYSASDTEGNINWYSGCAIKYVQCSDGRNYHVFQDDRQLNGTGNLRDNQMFYMELPSSYTVDNIYKHELRYDIGVPKQLKELNFYGNITAETWANRCELETVRFYGDAHIVRFSASNGDRPLNNVSAYFYGDNVELLNMSYMNLTYVYIADGEGTVTLGSQCLSFNWDLQEIHFGGTMDRWYQRVSRWTDWERYTGLERIVCTDGVITNL